MSKQQLMLAINTIEECKRDLEKELDDLIDSGEHIVADYSYCDADTGFNYVEDVEFSDEYLDLVDRIEVYDKLLEFFEERSEENNLSN